MLLSIADISFIKLYLIKFQQTNNDDIVINENGVTICNQKVVSNKINSYFVNVGQDLLKDLGESNNKFQDYLKKS